jgi:deoxycytidine triphosphate deaminase
MAEILKDTEIEQLFGNVIVNGDIESIRPNSYILRLGATGEFLNTGKLFSLGEHKKGISVMPGHSVALTAFETIDFRRETVNIVFPNYTLHGLISPTTDFSREGILAPTTQIDAGYYGTLNWTITNAVNESRRVLFKEKIFRLTIFKLGREETPKKLYSGDYQGLLGYVRSMRKGPHSGIKESEWEDPYSDDNKEGLSTRTQNHYLLYNKVKNDIEKIKQRYNWIITIISASLVLLGMSLTFSHYKFIIEYLRSNIWLGSISIIFGIIIFLTTRVR